MKPSQKEIKQFYDDATIRKLHGFVHSNKRVEYAWQSLLGIFSFEVPKRILEIGSGIGEISYRMACDNPESEIVGFDISEQSIKIASDLFVASNLSYIRADTITEAKFTKGKKFDLVLLMDVYEHIPMEERANLHQFITENISENGFVFFSCPTPQHLEDLKINNPSEIQPVDENITLEVLMNFSKQTNLRITSYKEVGVWRAADYFHVIFSNYPALQEFSDFEKKRIIGSIGLKNEILRKIRPGKVNPYSVDLDRKQQEKKELIKSRLGMEILRKVEAF